MNNKSFRQNLSFGRIVATAAFVLVAASAVAQTAPPAPPAPPPGGAMDHGAMGHDMKGMGGMGGAAMGGMDHGAGGGMAGMSHGGGGMGMMQKMLCGVTEHVDGRLAYLKAELKLTDQQQGAWNTFADAYRAATQKTAKICASNEAAAAGGDHSMHHGVLGHLSMMEHHMSDHLDSLRALKGAIEPLYSALTDEQKKTADHVLTDVMEVGMGKMGGGGMDHGGGGMGSMGH
jgi:hypothetical protein